jgi:hypothetical protein
MKQRKKRSRNNDSTSRARIGPPFQFKHPDKKRYDFHYIFLPRRTLGISTYLSYLLGLASVLHSLLLCALPISSVEYLVIL